MGSRITGFNALQLVTDNPAQTASEYAAFFGSPAPSPADADNRQIVPIQAGNIELTIATGATAPGMSRLTFGVDDLASWPRRLKRLNLLSAENSDSRADTESSLLITTPSESTRGLSLAFSEQTDHRGSPPGSGGITGVDHIVVNSTNPEATAALWGARLGLDMRLDLTRPEWGVRLMFFRVGDAILEVAHRLDESASGATDHWYGISWRTDDAAQCRERLVAQGFDVSEVRDGRKPGSQVFTVRDAPAAVPTLIIQPPTARPIA